MTRQHALYTVAAMIATSLCLAALLEQAQAAALDLSNTPLTLRTGVAPNLILTLDDSGSMDRDYIPNDRGYGKASYSASYNGMAYNPNITYAPPVDGNGNEFRTFYTNAYTDGLKREGSNDLSDNWNGWREPRGAKYSVFDGNNQGCYNDVSDNTDDVDCYDWVYVNNSSTAQKQNYANWYSFYRTRRLTTLTGASRAFSEINDNMRVGWQGLNRDTYITEIRPLTGNHRTNLYNWFQSMYAKNGTPLRAAMQDAGERYRQPKPYYNNPDDSSQGSATCRQNYHLLMTDGKWNGGLGSNIGNDDNKSHTLPDREPYSPKAPYKDDQGDPTLADLAFNYWRQDLRRELDDEVPPFMPNQSGTEDDNYWNPRNDPATWQHMVTFTVGLGLTQNLTDPAWGGSTYTGDFSSIEDGTKSWPAVDDDSSNNPYDLWHAAINSRGQFFSADDPQSLTNAFQTILERITERTASNTATATQSGDVDTSDSVYQAEYNSRGWSGELYSYVLNNDGSKGAIRWAAGCALDGGQCDADGRNYGSGLSAGQRRIVTWQPGTAKGVAFQWKELTAKQKNALNDGDSLGQQRLNYLRGDRSNEAQYGGSLRDRTSVLGDIAHSSPVFVDSPAGPKEKYYENGPNGLKEAARKSYDEFKEDHADRRKMIYVGANDGMLHAFYADHDKPDSGREAFAFVPNSVYPNLSDYTAPDYTHQPYVDATPNVGDAYFNNEWHTVLAGGLRGGGQGVYALDVTGVPTDASTEANLTDKVLWEFSDQDDADLGYTFGKPQIFRLDNGEWAAVFGNGYNNTAEDGNKSATGNAVLYIVSIADGSLIKKIDTGVGKADDPTGNGRPNGLATPALADSDGDSVYDYAYAGDLFGNLWKFDLSGGNAGDWSVAYRAGTGNKPLFQARRTEGSTPHPQPITAAPKLWGHPSGQGVMVMFGTGKYIEANDATAKPTVESVYGIWDRNIRDGDGDPVYIPFGHEHLLEQEILKEVQANGETGRLMSDYDIAWYSATKEGVPVNDDSSKVPPAPSDRHLGWYFDLKVKNGTAKGEMMIEKPTKRGKILLFDTLTPNDDPCSSGASGFEWAVDFRNGSYPPGKPVFDANGDGVYDESDKFSVPEETDKLPLIGMGYDDEVVTAGDSSNYIGTTEDGEVANPKSGRTLNIGANPLNRQAWRQIR